MFYFKVQYWRTDEKTDTFSEYEVLVEKNEALDVSSNDQTILTQVLVKRLYPYSKMAVQVRVINNFYVGPPSELVVFQTYEGGLLSSFIFKKAMPFSILLSNDLIFTLINEMK